VKDFWGLAFIGEPAALICIMGLEMKPEMYA
jgi:hypothetical protein